MRLYPLSLLALGTPAAAQTLILDHESVDFEVASTELGYGCTVTYDNELDATVHLHELALDTGELLRTAEVWTGPDDYTAPSGLPDAVGCAVEPALDLGVVVVAFLGPEVESGNVKPYTAVVDATTLVSEGGVKQGDIPIYRWSSFVQLERVGDEFVFVFFNVSLNFGYAHFSLDDLRTGEGSFQTSATFNPDGINAKCCPMPTAMSTALVEEGGVERMVLGSIDSIAEGHEEGTFRYFDATGLLHPDDHILGLVTTTVTGDAKGGAPRIFTPPYVNGEGEASFLVLNDVSPFTEGGDYSLSWWNDQGDSVFDGVSVDLVTGEIGHHERTGGSLSPVTDATLFQGTDWVVANRDPVNSKLVIHRFPAAYAPGEVPVMGPGVEVDATFCGAMPTVFSAWEEEGWSVDNDFVRVREVPSGLLAVAYVACPVPQAPALHVAVVDPAFPDSDVVVDLAADAASAVPGSSVTYTLEVRNDGADANDHVTVSADFAVGLSGCDGILEDVTLAAGASRSWSRTCAVDQGTSGTLAATAWARTVSVDADPADNQDAVDLPVEADADLGLTLTGEQTVDAGDTVATTLTVTNAGPSDATGVLLTLDVPAGWTSAATTGCAEDPDGAPACTLGTLAAGASAVVELTATAGADGTYTLSARVAGADGDSDATDDTASLEVTVRGDADLSVTLDNGVVEQAPDAATTYTLVVANDGPADVTGARVVDEPPDNLRIGGWTCSGAGGGSCPSSSGTGALDETVSLPSGAAVTFQVAATHIRDGADVVYGASVASTAQDDPDPTNNTATDIDAAPAPEDKPATAGCGCALGSSPPPAAFWLALPLLLSTFSRSSRPT